MQKLVLQASAWVCVVCLCHAVRCQGLAEQEPNGSPAVAGWLPPLQQAYGVLTAGDEDWYQVVLSQAADLRAWTAPGFGAQAGNTRLTLFDAASNLVMDVDDGSLTTHGLYSFLEYGNLAAGTWYLRVRGFDGATTGTYTVEMTLAAPGTYVQNGGPPWNVVEAPEPNDLRLAGAVPTLSQQYSRNLGNIASPSHGASFTYPTGDYDFYRIDLQDAGLLVLATAAGVAPAATDTVLHLCDAGWNRIAFDDDSGPGFYSVLRYQILVPGTYFAVVSDYGVGNYELLATFVRPVQGGASSVSVHGGGCGPWGGVPNLQTRFTSTVPLVRIEKPVLGSMFYLDATNLPPGSLLIRLAGQLPRVPGLDLTTFGAPGCRIDVDPTSIDVAIADASGVHFWGIAMAFDLNLVGLPLEQQVIVFDPGANALGVRITNRVTSVAGSSH